MAVQSEPRKNKKLLSPGKSRSLKTLKREESLVYFKIYNHEKLGTVYKELSDLKTCSALFLPWQTSPYKKIHGPSWGRLRGGSE